MVKYIDLQNKVCVELNNEHGSELYEICYADSYDLSNSHWHNDSLFVHASEFMQLTPHLNHVFHHFHYYGAQLIRVNEWNHVKEVYASSDSSSDEFDYFFRCVDSWLRHKRNDADYFWILGV